MLPLPEVVSVYYGKKKNNHLGHEACWWQRHAGFTAVPSGDLRWQKSCCKLTSSTCRRDTKTLNQKQGRVKMNHQTKPIRPVPDLSALNDFHLLSSIEVALCVHLFDPFSPIVTVPNVPLSSLKQTEDSNRSFVFKTNACQHCWLIKCWLHLLL